MENTKSKTIIFIGNGFDVAFGMKTAYKDFLKSREFNYLSTGNNLSDFIKGKVDREKGKWVDVEVELGNYSKHLTSLKKNDTISDTTNVDERFKQEYDELQKALFLYLQRQNGGETNPALERLIKQWKLEKDVYVVCFNYTPNAFNEFNENLPKCPVLKVHGNVNYDGSSDYSKIVFGVDETCGISEENNFIHKSSNSNINAPKLKQRMLNAEKFVFFGCSLGETDTWYFSDLFKKATDCTFHFYCFGNKEELSIKARINKLSGSLQDFTSLNTIEYFDSSKLKEIVPIGLEYALKA